MRRRALLSAAALLVAAGVGLGAQAKPDFSGKWVMDPPPAAADAGRGGGRGAGGAGGGPGFGPAFSVTQDAATISIDRGQGGALVFKLDGTESRNTIRRDGQPQEQIGKTTWEGNTLVITTVTNAAEQRRALSLEGANLVIEQTNPGRAGGGSTKTVYKKG